MIQKYTYGTPFETDAIVTSIPASEGTPAYGTISTENGFSFTYDMDDNDVVYGLGESNRGINKNIGMHRYGGIEDENKQVWWFHILLNLKMMPSLNMCGFLYTGADLGGFGADTAREFLLRHLALGVFIPLMLGNEIMIALNEVPLFIREGKCIPVAEVAESVDQIDLSTLTMLGLMRQISAV